MRLFEIAKKYIRTLKKNHFNSSLCYGIIYKIKNLLSSYSKMEIDKYNQKKHNLMTIQNNIFKYWTIFILKRKKNQICNLFLTRKNISSKNFFFSFVNKIAICYFRSFFLLVSKWTNHKKFYLRLAVEMSENYKLC